MAHHYIRQIVEEKPAQMLALHPLRMSYEKKYREIITAYNQDKDRATIEDTFSKLMDLANGLDTEQRRAVKEGLGEGQLAPFCGVVSPPRSTMTRSTRGASST